MNSLFARQALLFFFCCAFLLPKLSKAQTSPNQDSLTLVALFDATNGQNWLNKTNWKVAGRPISTWYGVSVNAQGYVQAIQLSNNRLSGSLPPMDMAFLQDLSLSGNQLTGTIPAFNMPNLVNMLLSYNGLTGRIPNFNMPYLQTLTLSFNYLTDTIPNFYLPNLLRLNLDANRLTGGIPDFYLPNLRWLILNDNLLRGAIPTFYLPRLERLILNNNFLTDGIPNFDFPNLRVLYLHNNRLKGCLPISLQNFCRIGINGDVSNNPELSNQNWTHFCSTGAGAGASVSITPSDSSFVCFGRTVLLAATATGGQNYTYQWSRDGQTLVGETNANLIASVSGNYNVSVSSQGCSNIVTNPKPVTVSIYPSLPKADSVFYYCLNSPASPLTATGVGLRWYTTATGGIGSIVAPTPNTSVAGSTVYYVSQSSAGCESGRKPIIVTVLNAEAAAPIVNDVYYCQNAIASPLTAIGINLRWYTTATGGIASTTPPTPSTTTAGMAFYYVSQNTGGCESNRSLLVVTVSAYPSAPVVSPVFYCENAVATPLSISGGNARWYDMPTGGHFSTTAPTPNTAVLGTTVYYVSRHNNGCESPRVALSVTVSAFPKVPAANDVFYCQNAVPQALTAVGQNLLWYTQQFGGIGSTTAPMPSTTTLGTTTYYVSQTLNGCESGRQAVNVTVSAQPTAPIANTITYCQFAEALALNALGNNLLWYAAASGGVGSPNAPIPNTGTVGTNTYYVSQTVNGCESPRRALPVVVMPAPALPIANNVEYCQNTPTGSLTAGGLDLLWYNTATGGIGSPNAPTPNTAIPGISTYYVSQSVNGCESPRRAITVLIKPQPAAPVGTVLGYCQNAVAPPLSILGSNLLWYTAASGGTGNPVAPTPNTAVVGTTIHFVSQTVNGCESERAAIAINIAAMPPIPTGATINLCKDAIAAPLSTNGTNLRWYTTASGGIASPTAPIPTTRDIGTTIYYVSQSNNGCESPRAAIVVVVNPKPTAVFSFNIIDGAVNFTNFSIGAIRYYWTFGDAGNSWSVAENPSFNYRNNGVYTVKLVVTAPNGCTDSLERTISINRVGLTDLREKLSVQVFPNPVKTVLSIVFEGNQNYFKPNDQLFLTNTLGQIVWTSPITDLKIQVDMRKWASGLYFLSVRKEGFILPIGQLVKMD
jgi:PKD repeat protein